MISIFKKSSADSLLTKVEQPVTGSWINMVNPTKDEIAHISEATGIDKGMLGSVLEEEETPRVEKEEGNILIIIRLPGGDDEKSFSIYPLGIIIGSSHIVTISLAENCVVSDFLNMKVKNFFTTKKTRFLLQIFSRTNHHYKKYLDHLGKKVEDVERTITKSFKNEEILELLRFQKNLIYMSTAVVSNEKALEKILKGKVIKLYEEDEDLLEDIIIENKESIEMVNIYSNILSSTLDAYASLVSNNLNVVMKFLTSVTIILAIPTIVTSFYGMNVGLPVQQNPFAYLVVIGLSAVLMALASVFFIKKRYF